MEMGKGMKMNPAVTSGKYYRPESRDSGPRINTHRATGLVGKRSASLNLSLHIREMEVTTVSTPNGLERGSYKRNHVNHFLQCPA